MYNTTVEYKKEIKKPSRSFECRITIGEKVYRNEDLVDLKLESSLQPQEGFMIGSTTSTTLDLTLLNKGETIYSTSGIKLEIGIKIGSTIEYVPMGIFNVDEVVKTDSIIKITAFDNMIKFEAPYISNLKNESNKKEESDQEYNATLQEVVNELASSTGVEFTGGISDYKVKILEGFTCREILAYVASLCGGNAVITREGKFTIIDPKKGASDYHITGDNYFDYKIEEVDFKIGKVSCQVDDKVLTKGDLQVDSMELQFQNPWVTESILEDIYKKLNGFNFIGYTLKWQGDFSIDLGDVITCMDSKGEVRKLTILNQKINYNGGLTSEISAKGETKNKNSFNSSGGTTKKIDRVVTELAIVNDARVNYALINDAKIVNLEAKTAKIGELEAETANIERVLLGKAEIGTVEAIDGRIDQLASTVITTESLETELLKAQEATISKIKSDYIDAINIDVKDLKVISGEFDKIEGEFAEIKKVVAEKVTADRVEAMLGDFDKIIAGNMESNEFTAGQAVIKKLQTDLIETNKLVANKISAKELKAEFAKLDQIIAGTVTSNEFNGIIGRFETIEASTGTFEEIFADKIIVDELGAKKINASFLEAGSITAESGVLGKGVIGQLQLAEGSVNSLHIGKGEINEAHISNLTVLDGFIKSLKAEVITSGTLDASKINVTNLTADNITTGSITVLGDNLIHNSAIKKPLIEVAEPPAITKIDNRKDWLRSTGSKITIIQGTPTDFEGYNYIIYNEPKLVSDEFSSLAMSRIPMRPGNKFVFSFYVLKYSNDKLGNNFGIALDLYEDEASAITGKTDKEIIIKSWTDKTIPTDKWERLVVEFEVPSKTWPNVIYGNVRPRLEGSGKIRIAKPMLSKGSIASIFKEHTDELISDGAIGNDQLEDESISTSKLQLDELFVNEAFAQKLSTIELHSNQITAGKIKSEFLEIESIVKFSSFTKEVREMFVFPTDGDSTYIDGGKIFTNSINAESINAKGLKVSDPSGKTTFEIDENGEVFVTGNIESAGFDPNKKQGYSIEKNGNIIMNNALVRGDVILENAGITNYGGGDGTNFLRNSNFSLEKVVDSSVIWDKSLNGDKLPTYWSGFNKGVDQPEKGYHAHLDTTKFPFNTIVFENLNSKYGLTNRWLGLSHGIPLDVHQFKANKKYTFSMDVYCDTAGFILHGGLYHKIIGSTSTAFGSGSYEFTMREDEKNKWVRKSWTFTTNENMDVTQTSSWYVYGSRGKEGRCWIKNLKLEEGDISNEWSPENEKLGENIRFWAGATYDKRNDAPFKVLQDGTIFATKGVFDGTWTGVVQIGNIKIEDTNNSKARFEICTKDNVDKRVSLTDDISNFNQPVTFGDEDSPYLKLDSNSKIAELNNGKLIVQGSKYTFTLDGASTGNLMNFNFRGNHGEYNTLFRYDAGTFTFTQEGDIAQNVPDFKFQKNNGSTPSTSKFIGDVEVTEEIKVGSVRMVKKLDSGNEGIDFII